MTESPVFTELARGGAVSIIKLVNSIVAEAERLRASDIHIDPQSGQLRIRYRIDGILYDILSLPRKFHSPLVSRVKIMVKLNIAEKRLPQDGRIEIKVADRSVDIRVSTIPTAFGERVVLRLLDKTSSILMLSDLGMDDRKVGDEAGDDEPAGRRRPEGPGRRDDNRGGVPRDQDHQTGNR